MGSLATKRSLEWVYVKVSLARQNETQHVVFPFLPQVDFLLLFEQLHGILYLEILSLEAVKQIIIECLKQGRIWDCADNYV